MRIERADRTVKVPARARSEAWTAEVAQRWARQDILCGGPPEKPIDPESNTSVDWDEVRDWAGRPLRIRAKPMGLLIEDPTGQMRYYPADSSGFPLGTTSSEMQKETELERRLREFAKGLVGKYNKNRMKSLRREGGNLATREFWLVGKEIRGFIQGTPGLTQDRVWYALENWGRGEGGYSKNWLEYGTYLYDWLPEAGPDDDVFRLSETRVMNILRATKAPEERRRLLESSISGVLKDFSDEEFKWVTGQSPTTFPLGPERFTEFKRGGDKIGAGESLNSSDLETIAKIRGLCNRSSLTRSQPPETSAE